MRLFDNFILLLSHRKQQFSPLSDLVDILIMEITDRIDKPRESSSDVFISHGTRVDDLRRLVSAPIFVLNKYIYLNTTGNQSDDLRCAC